MCIGVLWTSMSQKRGSESKQVGIPLMSSSAPQEGLETPLHDLYE